MNPDLDRLQAYPFTRLNRLLADITVNSSQPQIDLAIGEPQQAPPALIPAALTRALGSLNRYPSTHGQDELRTAISAWLTWRYNLVGVDPNSQVLPVNGTREALFAFPQCWIDRRQRPVVVMPNPFYQIYAGAAWMAGAEPVYLDCDEGNGFLPDMAAVPASVWQRCQLLYLCNPGNPTGAIMDENRLQQCIALADEYDFVIAADECYSEIYFDEASPPPGLLGAAARLNRHDYRRCIVFNSLSKRSNAAGLRAGFVAGDAGLLSRFLHYRTYHGCAMPLHHQAAAAAAWRDEIHVRHNRQLYREKCHRMIELLSPIWSLPTPPGGFFLWPKVGDDEEELVRKLYLQANLRVLPGRYLSQSHGDQDPGARRVRIALVAPIDTCLDAAERIRAL